LELGETLNSPAERNSGGQQTTKVSLFRCMCPLSASLDTWTYDLSHVRAEMTSQSSQNKHNHGRNGGTESRHFYTLSRHALDFQGGLWRYNVIKNVWGRYLLTLHCKQTLIQ
jgi:hypothetical protein